MLRNWAISLRFFPILKKAELAYAMRSAWLHLALTALLTLGITIWSRSAKAMVQALIASCSSLLQTSRVLLVLCAAALHPRLATLAASSWSSFSTVSSSTATFFFMTLHFTIFTITKQRQLPVGEIRMNKASLNANTQKRCACDAFPIIVLFIINSNLFSIKQPLEIFLWRKYLL